MINLVSALVYLIAPSKLTFNTPRGGETARSTKIPDQLQPLGDGCFTYSMKNLDLKLTASCLTILLLLSLSLLSSHGLTIAV